MNLDLLLAMALIGIWKDRCLKSGKLLSVFERQNIDIKYNNIKS